MDKIKKYKSGLVLGKFYGFHTGHVHLINTAIENSEKVHVIVCHNSTQNIPGIVRYEAVKNTFKNNRNVTVYSFCDEGLPQYSKDCETKDEFYSLWIPEIYKIVKELDVVFTSELYGEDFAKYLGSDHYMVDLERKTYPISGTRVRKNPFKEWEFIPTVMKPFFVKKIAIMGTESAGKSTLAENLAKKYNTEFVEEYGRILYEEKSGNLTIDDFPKIVKGKEKLESEKISKSNKILFCDTEEITTYIFSEMYFPNEYKKYENWFIDKINKSKKYDLYILLKPDCPAVQDGTRSFLENRWEHYKNIKNTLDKFNRNYVEIGGRGTIDLTSLLKL